MGNSFHGNTSPVLYPVLLSIIIEFMILRIIKMRSVRPLLATGSHQQCKMYTGFCLKSDITCVQTKSIITRQISSRRIVKIKKKCIQLAYITISYYFQIKKTFKTRLVLLVAFSQKNTNFLPLLSQWKLNLCISL